MKFLSVCSGIEAASVAFNPLGWKAVAFSEIELFPCSLLKHHYPDTPNWGDMNNFKDWPDVSIDLLCGGTPCQSFSVAGLRKGLDDPRGNLMLTFGAIAAKYRPKWLVWENVPGVLSSNGGNDFRSFLDMLEELGYVCDIEILDAQYFGVAQRRRRVFVCGQHRDDLLIQKTDSSALTITQCLQEILQAILTEGCSKLGNAPESSALPIHSRDGATRRMRLFGLDGEGECWPMLRENLIAAFQRFQQGQKQSDAPLGESEKELMLGGQLTVSQKENPFTLTEQSLKTALDEALEVMKLFTTSTPTKPITQAQIYTCSRAVLLIAKLTHLLNQSSPAFWNSALSSLTVIEEYTNYARSTNSDLFGDVERFQAWRDFIEQAEQASESFLDIRIECFGEIFSLPDCLQGHPAPSRQAGKAAPTIHSRSTAGGGLGTDFDCDGGLIPAVSSTLLEAQAHVPCIAFPERMSGTQCAAAENLAPSMGALNPTAIAYTTKLHNTTNNQAGKVYEEYTTALDRSSPPPALLTAMQVRRLTPRECERLQGFKDNYTAIPGKRKAINPDKLYRDYVKYLMRGGTMTFDQCCSIAADGPRYKALGNSWAIPNVQWIGRRIDAVQAIHDARRLAA